MWMSTGKAIGQSWAAVAPHYPLNPQAPAHQAAKRLWNRLGLPTILDHQASLNAVTSDRGSFRTTFPQLFPTPPSTVRRRLMRRLKVVASFSGHPTL